MIGHLLQRKRQPIIGPAPAGGEGLVRSSRLPAAGLGPEGSPLGPESPPSLPLAAGQLLQGVGGSHAGQVRSVSPVPQPAGHGFSIPSPVGVEVSRDGGELGLSQWRARPRNRVRPASSGG